MNRLAFSLSRTIIRSLGVLLGLLMAIVTAGAQPSGGGGVPTTTGTSSSGGNPNGSFYDYSSGSLNMEVNIWGFVGSPGKYKVPASTRLIQLISLSGGPTDRARL